MSQTLHPYCLVLVAGSMNIFEFNLDPQNRLFLRSN